MKQQHARTTERTFLQYAAENQFASERIINKGKTIMDIVKTLEFLDALAGPVGLALTEARAGRFAVVNKVMSNPALGHYLKSVGSPPHNQPRYSAETWARCFPTLVEQADAIREDYEVLQTGNLDIGDITVPGGNVSL